MILNKHAPAARFMGKLQVRWSSKAKVNKGAMGMIRHLLFGGTKKFKAMN
jgi:hypothetical protein